MTITRTTAAVLAAFLLAACATDFQNRPKQTGGTIIGAIGGGLAGAQFGSGKGQLAATAIGTLLGAWIGNEVGRSLDQADRLYAERAHNQALTSGETIRWDNPESGNYGYVTPTRAGTDTKTGAFCREFQTTVIVGGEEQKAYGTACQQPDGSWQIIK